MKTQFFALAGAATNYLTPNSAPTGADSSPVFMVDNIMASTLPEVETMVILGLGLAVLVLASRRRRWK